MDLETRQLLIDAGSELHQWHSHYAQDCEGDCPSEEIIERIQEAIKPRPTLGEFIQGFCRESERKDDHRVVHRGSALNLDMYSNSDCSTRLHLPDGFVEKEEWNNGFRAVWISTAYLAFITYCEGDIIVVVCDGLESYNDELIDARSFYEGRN